MTAKEMIDLGTAEGLATLGGQVMYQHGWRMVETELRPELVPGWELRTPGGRGRAMVRRGTGDHEAEDEISAWIALFNFGGLDNPCINLTFAVGLLRGQAWQIYNGARSKWVECLGQKVEIHGDHPSQIAAALSLAWLQAQLA